MVDQARAVALQNSKTTDLPLYVPFSPPGYMTLHTPQRTERNRIDVVIVKSAADRSKLLRPVRVPVARTTAAREAERGRDDT